MDIAEIRKKAKAQSAPDPRPAQTPESQSVQTEGPEQEPESFELSDELAVELQVSETLPEPVGELVTTQASADGLDRLFAATEEFVLATEGSYTDILHDQANVQSRTNLQLLAFHLGNEEYALDIKRISEIIKVREFTDIPRTPDFILGIISLRGVVVPVFDLRLRLNLGESELTASSRIVVCQLGEVSVGLLVDSINQVVNLFDEDVEPPPGVLSGLDREMIAGIGRYQGRMIILLNLASVLDVDALI